MTQQEDWIQLGYISGIFGLKGWVKVFSHTAPREQILDYDIWYLMRDQEPKAFRLLDGQKQSKTIIAALGGIETPEQGTELGGMRILIKRAQLPPAEPGEYYWIDLIGLSVNTTEGASLGKVQSMMETGSNDVLVVEGERERLVPFIQGSVIQRIDLAGGQIVVKWDPEF